MSCHGSLPASCPSVPAALTAAFVLALAPSAAGQLAGSGGAGTRGGEATALVGTTVKGTVRYASGAAAANARVRAGAFGSTTSSASGAFSMFVQVLPGRGVRATAEVHGLGTRHVGSTTGVAVVPNGVTDVGTVTVEPEPFRFPGPEVLGPGQAIDHATLDFDGDGRLDLALLSEGEESHASVFLAVDEWSVGPEIRTPTGDDKALAMAAGDFDGDERADLVVLHDVSGLGASYPLILLLGQGDGSFVSAGTIAYSPKEPKSVAGVDLDGDDDLDLVVGDQMTAAPERSLAKVLLNDGSGAFAAPAAFETSSVTNTWTLAMTTADVDADGAPDLIATIGHHCGSVAPKANRFSVLLGNGDGTLGSPTTTSQTAAADWMTAGDLDGDTDVDLVVGGAMRPANPFDVCASIPSGFHVYLGDGAGSFAAFASSTEGGSHAALGDLDGDSALDLVLATGTLTSVWGGLGNGSFTSPTAPVGAPLRRAAVVDFGGDGDLDVVGATDSGIAVLEGGGDGSLSAPSRVAESTSLYAAPTSTGVGDFDGDAVPDLVLFRAQVSSSSFARLEILPGDGGGSFLAATETINTGGYRALTTGDLDSDSNLDLVAEGELAYFGNGDGTLLEPAVVLDSSSDQCALGDLDGDGDLDVVTRRFTAVGVRRNNGDRTFAPLVLFPSGANEARGLALADLDGDTALDVVVADRDSGTLYPLLGDNTGAFVASPSIALGGEPLDVAAADLDADGDLDLVAADGSSGELQIVLGTGGGSFAAPMSTPFSPGSSSFLALLLRDLDGDGRIDAGVRHGGSMALLLGDGGGGFGAPLQHCAGPSGRTLSAADLDGDGDLDLVTGTGRSALVLENLRSP